MPAELTIRFYKIARVILTAVPELYTDRMRFVHKDASNAAVQ